LCIFGVHQYYRMGNVICFWSGKGGTGKSTLSIMVYLELKRLGIDSIAMLDIDPQLTAYNLVKQLGKLDIDIYKYKDREKAFSKKFTIVDCPPLFDSVRTKAVMLQSKLVCIPARPSPPDTISLLSSIETIKEIQKESKNLQAAVILNSVVSNNKFVGEIRDLINSYDIKVMTTSIGQRLAYQKALLSGDLRKEKNVKANTEIEHLVNEIVRIISLNIQ